MWQGQFPAEGPVRWFNSTKVRSRGTRFLAHSYISDRRLRYPPVHRKSRRSDAPGRLPGRCNLQAIAAENNLAETAFLLPDGGDYRLRWFTPATEVPLCGHATLASAAVVMEHLEPGRTSVVFTPPAGRLR